MTSSQLQRKVNVKDHSKESVRARLKETLKSMIAKPKRQNHEPRPLKPAENQKRLVAKLKRWDNEEKQLDEEIQDIDYEFKLLRGDRSQSRKKDNEQRLIN